MESVVDRLRRYGPADLRAAVALAIVSATVAGSTYLPGAPILPGALTWLCFGLVFVVFPVALIPVALSGQNRGRGRESRRTANRQLMTWLRERASKRLLTSVALVFFAAWLSGMTGLLGTQGQPENHDGRYYADDHGSLLPLTKAQYDHQVALADRAFASIATAFYAVAVLLVVVGPLPRELTQAQAPMTR